LPARKSTDLGTARNRGDEVIECEKARVQRAVFCHACKLGLEGIVSKRRGSPYRSGRLQHWLKSKRRVKYRDGSLVD
jgi:ATP-dependent DNA ligase